MSIFIMFAPKKERQRKKEKIEERNEMVGIHAWKVTRDARHARIYSREAHVKGPAKKKTAKNVPPNQCSRPTELIPAKGFFVASISSDAISPECPRESTARIAFPNQSATNQPSMPGFLVMNVRNFSLYLIRVCIRASVIPRDGQWRSAIRGARRAAMPKRALRHLRRYSSERNFTQVSTRRCSALMPPVSPFITISAKHAARVY